MKREQSGRIPRRGHAVFWWIALLIWDGVAVAYLLRTPDRSLLPLMADPVTNPVPALWLLGSVVLLALAIRATLIAVTRRNDPP